MEINEFNDLTTDNTATSDEIRPNTDYVRYGKTEYAKAHSFSKSAVLTASLLTVSAVGGGALLKNGFLGSAPELTVPPQVEYVDDTASYTLSIENKGRMTATLSIYIGYSSDTIHTKDISKTGEYQDTVTLNPDTFYILSVDVTNHLDYHKNLYKEVLALKAGDTVSRQAILSSVID